MSAAGGGCRCVHVPDPIVTAPGAPIAIVGFAITQGNIVAIDILADQERLDRLDLAFLTD